VKAAQQEKPTSLRLATIMMEPPEAAAQSQRSLWLWTTCAEWPDVAYHTGTRVDGQRVDQHRSKAKLVRTQRPTRQKTSTS